MLAVKHWAHPERNQLGSSKKNNGRNRVSPHKCPDCGMLIDEAEETHFCPAGQPFAPIDPTNFDQTRPIHDPRREP